MNTMIQRALVGCAALGLVACGWVPSSVDERIAGYGACSAIVLIAIWLRLGVKS